MPILFNDLQRHYESMQSALQAAAERVLSSGWYVLGPEVQAFETAWAKYCETQHCVSLASGTDALEIALRAVGVAAGDEVLTVANAGGYTSTATRAIGALPRYVDIDPTTFTMDAHALEAQITSATRAIVVVHLYGCVADLGALRSLADAHDLPLIEDCAQAHGARWNGQPVGSIGDIGCFSFYPTKNLGALGDGGAIVTQDAELGAQCRRLRTYGWSEKYTITLDNGINSRLDELQAAFLQVKLVHLTEHNTRRKTIAARYATGLAGLPLQLPMASSDHVYHLYVVQVAPSKREQIMAQLKAADIGCDIHYPIPDYKQPAWQADYVGLQLPHTEHQAQTSLSLPCYPELSDSEIDIITATLQSILAP